MQLMDGSQLWEVKMRSTFRLSLFLCVHVRVYLMWQREGLKIADGWHYIIHIE